MALALTGAQEVAAVEFLGIGGVGRVVLGADLGEAEIGEDANAAGIGGQGAGPLAQAEGRFVRREEAGIGFLPSLDVEAGEHVHVGRCGGADHGATDSEMVARLALRAWARGLRAMVNVPVNQAGAAKRQMPSMRLPDARRRPS